MCSKQTIGRSRTRRSRPCGPTGSCYALRRTRDLAAVPGRVPGPVVDLAAVKMDFHYDDWFPKEPNVGYETIGDPTLFMRADMVEQAWRIVQPVLDAWTAEKADFPDYDSGSDGPNAADELLARDGGRVWRKMAQLSEHKT